MLQLIVLNHSILYFYYIRSLSTHRRVCQREEVCLNFWISCFEAENVTAHQIWRFQIVRYISCSVSLEFFPLQCLFLLSAVMFVCVLSLAVVNSLLVFTRYIRLCHSVSFCRLSSNNRHQFINGRERTEGRLERYGKRTKMCLFTCLP